MIPTNFWISSTVAETNDLAQTEYWDALWKSSPSPDRIRLRAWDVINRELDILFRRCFSGLSSRSRILEVGCAPGAWMTYFKQSLGLRVYGIDYSHVGVEITRRNLALHDVDAEVFVGDFLTFDFPTKFDAIVSFGVIEHYLDMEGFLRRCSELLVDDGFCMASIPNFRSGFYWSLQHAVGYDILRRHVPYSSSDLTTAFSKTGFRDVSCSYVGTFSIGVINFSSLVTPSRRYIATFLHYSDVALRLLSKAVLQGRQSPLWAPYIFAWGRGSPSLGEPLT